MSKDSHFNLWFTAFTMMYGDKFALKQARILNKFTARAIKKLTKKVKP